MRTKETRKKGSKISIVIPSYNSGERLIKVLERLRKVKIPGVLKEIIVVNDASKDPIYRTIKKMSDILYIEHRKNTGKGGAVRTGFKRATGDILLIQDDDLEYDPFDIPLLLKPLLQNKTKVVFGSRRLNPKNRYSSQTYFWGGVLLNSIFSLILRKNITDSITGSKVFFREVYEKIQPIETNGFEIEAELTAKIVRAGYKIYEVPISYSPRTHEEGKNVRWHHGLKILTTLWKYSR